MMNFRGPVSSITYNDIHHMQELYDSDNRTGMYLYYFSLTGRSEALLHAKISSFSGLIGAVADCSNKIIQKKVFSLYPKGGVDEFSKEIAKSLLDRVENEVRNGKTGFLSDRQIFETAREKWVEKGLGDYFPGNLFTFKYFCSKGSFIAILSFVKVMLAWGKVYGRTNNNFSDKTKFLWIHRNIYGKYISYVVQRNLGIIKFIES